MLSSYSVFTGKYKKTFGFVGPESPNPTAPQHTKNSGAVVSAFMHAATHQTDMTKMTARAAFEEKAEWPTHLHWYFSSTMSHVNVKLLSVFVHQICCTMLSVDRHLHRGQGHVLTLEEFKEGLSNTFGALIPLQV